MLKAKAKASKPRPIMNSVMLSSLHKNKAELGELMPSDLFGQEGAGLFVRHCVARHANSCAGPVVYLVYVVKLASHGLILIIWSSMESIQASTTAGGIRSALFPSIRIRGVSVGLGVAKLEFKPL